MKRPCGRRGHIHPTTLQFETDKDRNVITNPVTGWVRSSFAGMGVILAIRYPETLQALETGESKSIQFVMTPRQYLELADRPPLSASPFWNFGRKSYLNSST